MSKLSLAFLRPRLANFVQTWQPHIAKEFRAYDRVARTRSRSGKWTNSPFWLHLPLWTAAFISREKGPVPRRFLSDIIWAQYCLFLFIKIHDDIFDAHTSQRVLLFPGDAFFLEAKRSYLKYFDRRSRFWPFYFSSLLQTLNAIVIGDQTQLGGAVSHGTIARIYSRGYSACKISLFAICLQTRCTSLFPNLSRLIDQLAVTGQLLDDFEDINKDLQRGRLNYAAYCLSGKPTLTLIKKHAVEKMMKRNILWSGAGESFFKLLHGHIRHAKKISDTLSIPEVSDCIRAYFKTVTVLESELHRRRVQMLFARMPPTSRKRTNTNL